MSYINPSIVLLENPIGIDAVVQSYQQNLYSGLDWLDKSFGRSWEQPTQGNKKELVTYIGQGEYYPVLFNDNFKAQSFIAVRSPERRETPDTWTGVERDISIVFWVNLKELNRDLDMLFIETLRAEVEQIIFDNPYTKLISAFYDERYEDIFLGYLDSALIEKHYQLLKYPYAGFRFDVTTAYPVPAQCQNWDNIFTAGGSRQDIELTIGLSPTAPAEGTTTYQNDLLKGRKIRLTRGGLSQYRAQINHQFYYAFDSTTGTIVVFPAWQPNETFTVESYGYL